MSACWDVAFALLGIDDQSSIEFALNDVDGSVRITAIKKDSKLVVVLCHDDFDALLSALATLNTFRDD